MESKKVWLVTGASKGLGLTLVKKLLDNGYKVAATSRNADSLRNEVGYNGPDFLTLGMKLADNENVADGVEQVIKTFGRIDIVVNNAGYGQLGTLEELADNEARENFEVNVFGMLNVIRNVMPYYRKQRSGAFFNISSIAGFLGTFPGWGVYNATKFAVAGLTEALSAEVKSMGITHYNRIPGLFQNQLPVARLP